MGYLGYGLPAHPSIEPRQWQKYQLAVAGLSNAVHSSHGCRAACFHGPGTGALVPCHMAFFLFAWFCLFFFFPLVLMGGGPALLLELRGSLHQLLVGFEQEPITLTGKRAGYCPAVEDASFAAAPE